MANIYPSTYPKEQNPDDPEFTVFELLKELPDNFHIFYSKKLVGTHGAKAETSTRDCALIASRKCGATTARLRFSAKAPPTVPSTLSAASIDREFRLEVPAARALIHWV